MNQFCQIVNPGSFEGQNHWYPKAFNATIHPMVSFFLSLSKSRIVERYCHLHPMVKKLRLLEILSAQPKYFRWAGADLINVTDEKGFRHLVLIENNSSPSGQKSMPLLDDNDELGSYRKLIEKTFLPGMRAKRNLPEGGLAVLYDKNKMETSGYAATLAQLTGEPVYYVYMPNKDSEQHVRFRDGVLHILTADQQWIPIRGAFRYVTQRPWNRIPMHTRTYLLNPVLSCLSGGRNKMIAAKAYDLYNAMLEGSGLAINTPETIRDVSKNEVPLWVERFGGQAVVKVPYSNAGQGVYTIVGGAELKRFMDTDFLYDQFIVQSLIGNYTWSSTSPKGRLYHVGTIPSTKGYTYVNDLRIMINATETGLRPLCIYSRMAEKPLSDSIENVQDSWKMLGTNLSVKTGENEWDSDTTRLLLMDRRDFNKLGIGLDDLIEGYIQTVLSTLAIDQMAVKLTNSKGKFRMKLFRSLNNDPKLIDEIMLS